MKIESFLFAVLFGILFASCSKDKSIKNYVIDSWETTYLKIEMKTYQKSDSTFVFEENFLNNPLIKVQSKYNKDGTFSAWFINRKGDKKSESTGKWHVKNDSLFVDFFYGGSHVKAGYLIEKTIEGFKGTSKYDWDKDGEYDDFLIMKTKRLKNKK